MNSSSKKVGKKSAEKEGKRKLAKESQEESKDLEPSHEQQPEDLDIGDLIMPEMTQADLMKKLLEADNRNKELQAALKRQEEVQRSQQERFDLEDRARAVKQSGAYSVNRVYLKLAKDNQYEILKDSEAACLKALEKSLFEKFPEQGKFFTTVLPGGAMFYKNKYNYDFKKRGYVLGAEVQIGSIGAGMTSKFNNMSMSFKWQLFGKEGDESFLGTSPEVVEKLPAVAYAVPKDLVKQLRSLNEPEEPKKKKE
jgi:hypothetical protein